MEAFALALAQAVMVAFAQQVGSDPNQINISSDFFEPFSNAWFINVTLGTAGYKVRVVFAQAPGGGVPSGPILEVALRAA